MFAYIKGNLEIKSVGYVVIDVNGVGYKIFMSETAIEKIGDIGKCVKVYTYLRVREDDMSLYGFNTNEELRMFELLLSVSGVGAKSAIAILSNITPSSFALAVITNDVSKIKALPGIGPKTAQRIILELKDKIKTEEAIQTENELQTSETVNKNEKINEAISALQVLGYTKKEIEKAIESANSKNDLSVEDIIKLGLKNLSK
jgi:Holliday junction DNA helicase RuvA